MKTIEIFTRLKSVIYLMIWPIFFTLVPLPYHTIFVNITWTGEEGECEGGGFLHRVLNA